MITTVSNRQLEIIQSAGQILTTSGVSGLTIKNLAKEMAFSESALYRHFSSKEEIIIALLDYLANDMDKRLGRVIREEETPKGKFIALFENQFAFFSENPHFIVAAFSDGLMEKSENINASILKLMAIKRKHLLPIINAGQKQNIFTNEIHSEEMIPILIGTFRMQMFTWRAANFTFDIQEKGKKMTQSILNLIKSK